MSNLTPSPRALARLAAPALFALAACHDHNDVTSTVTPASLAVASGGAQAGMVASALASPVVVQVLGASAGVDDVTASVTLTNGAVVAVLHETGA